MSKIPDPWEIRFLPLTPEVLKIEETMLAVRALVPRGLQALSKFTMKVEDWREEARKVIAEKEVTKVNDVRCCLTGGLKIPNFPKGRMK